ncbi:MAG: signal recognition particle [Sphingobacteriales bacterium BACL12 MAG-120802-bin5]|jgi:signal recognition particle subunit SRP54|nr:MAG: signal recognition particle [Sphingobacteriales bacterium BACL12 MAG-120802-bin5]
MFESLSNRLETAFQSLKGQGKISEINIASTVKEIRRALVDADVNYKIAKEFTDRIKDKALGEDVIKSVSPGQQMVKIVADELTELMGGTKTEINLKGSPAIILIAGLQGSGKTTFSAKLAKFIKSKNGRNPVIAACDVYRPAAINQLQVLGEQIGVPVYTDTDNKNPVDIAKKAINFARVNNHNVVIIDTAGRLAVDEQMMDEISSIKKAVQPTETLFIVDSMTGQDAVNTAKAFNDRLDFDGVVLTKLDGDTRGGAALTIKYVVNKPIKFISQGEKTDTLDIFHPDRMARRILGMGDIVSLVEKAQENYDAEKAAELQKKIRKNKFDFEDFLVQLGQIKKMGNIKDLMGMIPGIGKQIKDMDIDEKQFKKLEAMIQSMTPAERQDPDILNGSRRKRIADGSGSSIQDLNQFIKQFEEMRKMMKMMNKMGGGAKAARAMGMMGKR